jgi:PhnB protein
MTVNAIPDGCNSINVYVFVHDAASALDFYARAFDGQQGTVLRIPGSDMVMHGEVRIGNSTLMLSQENPDWGTSSARSLGGSPVEFMIYVEDVDAAIQRAVDAGCEIAEPVADAFWGDRMGKVSDPFGLKWTIATHVEDVPDEEMAKRAEKFLSEMQAS